MRNLYILAIYDVYKFYLSVKILSTYQPTQIQKLSDSHNCSEIKNNYDRSNLSLKAYPKGYVNFKGVNNVVRTPFLKSTVDTIDKLFESYHESLMEVSKEEVAQAVVDTMKETGSNKKTVLSAMQVLTQFANMRSVRHIGNVMEQEGIRAIGNFDHFLERECINSNNKKFYIFSDAVTNDVGLNKSLTYLLDKKNFAKLEGKNIAMFLDERKLSQLENLKEKNPEELKTIINCPNLKFFVLSGMEEGISIFNRTKNLKEETISLIKRSKETGKDLDEVIDENIIERARQLGIAPKIIKNKSELSEEGIYNAMRPEQMTKDELINIIDANAQVRIDERVMNSLVAKDISANYLKDNLNIYTPERLCDSLKEMHKNIVLMAEDLGKTEKDILYVIPYKVKSYDFINYSYQKINKIPPEQFAKDVDIQYERVSSKDKILVFLDDNTISGTSIDVTVNDVLREFPFRV